MLKITALLAVACSSTLALANAGDCAAQLSDAQRSAVRTAGEDGYSVRLLSKVVGERARTVVLVGESLLKTDSVARAGLRLTRAFRVLAHGGDGGFAHAWYPEATRRYLDERLRIDREARATDTYGSLAGAVKRDAKVMDYEDHVVERLGGLIAEGEFNLELAREAVTSIDLPVFDHDEVMRRLARREPVPPPRTIVNLEETYRPTQAHNLAILAVLGAEKFKAVSGRIGKFVSLSVLAGGAAVMAYSQGAHGLPLVLGAAAAFGLQHAMDFARLRMTSEFAGVPDRSRHAAAELESLLERADLADEVLVVVPEGQTWALARRLFERGFREELYLPRRLADEAAEASPTEGRAQTPAPVTEI